MHGLDKDTLRRLGQGETISSICAGLGIDGPEFSSLWKRTAAARVPPISGSVSAAVRRRVSIERDRFGIARIAAESDTDLFFGFGYAMAQDRLFQLDWLRRKGAGRLAEIVGNEGLASDVLARTVGLNRIARKHCEELPDETRHLLESFSAGINAVIDESHDNPPIEFDLLDYRPEPWRPLDSVLIEVEFAWYLTGRFPVIAIPELAKRHLGPGAHYRAFLTAEADDESILAPGDYVPRKGSPLGVGNTVNDPDGAIGSNNWVVAANRTVSGRPSLASDPHIALEAVSCWYQAHLQGGSFDVAGCAYVGMPAMLIGRNRRVTWGITNNICSLRDLYQEKTSSEHPGCFLFDGKWQQADELTELIHVRGFGPVSKRIVYTHNGPLIDQVLPPPANDLGAVSLRWLGAEHLGWLTALLKMNRANNGDTFRESLRPWHVPTFSVVFADVEGLIGYQATGRVPIRPLPERGFRPGWDPRHQWQGLIPFEEMPATTNPARGFVVTANNRVVGDDFPQPLCGTWTSGERAQRIRTRLEETASISIADHCNLQHDARSLRGQKSGSALAKLLLSPAHRADSEPNALVFASARALAEWNGDVRPDLVAPTVFNVFFVEWCRRVAVERFPEECVPLVSTGMEGLASALLQSDAADWFERSDRETAIRQTFRTTIGRLANQLGTDVSQWTWGRLHRLNLKHVLSSRGDLDRLLDHGGMGVRGDATTVCNTGRGPNFEAAVGAGYRMVCDLGETPPGIWNIDAQSQSGHPGSPHYSDQLPHWLEGKLHFVPLDHDTAPTSALILEPRA